MKSEKSKIPYLRPENTWYRTYNTLDEALEQIKIWDEKINYEYLEKLFTYQWRHMSERDKQSLINRTKCLMKIMILRAHDIVVTDFEELPNRYYNPSS